MIGTRCFKFPTQTLFRQCFCLVTKECCQKVSTQISISPYFRSESPNDVTNLIRDQLLFSSVCLERKTSEMFSLWKDFFNGSLVPNEACFETTLEGLTTRLNDLITMSAVGSKNGLAHSGHQYVRTHHMFSRILNFLYLLVF